jgi:hypothetical protein
VSSFCLSAFEIEDERADKTTAVLVNGRYGEIRSRDAHGHDPDPPKG